MTRGARKSGRLRSVDNKVRRVPLGYSRKSRILIVGEGQETEPNYFYGLKQEDEVRARFAVTVKPGPGLSPVRIVECALAHVQRAQARSDEDRYDEVWCVLDVEGPSKRGLLQQAVGLAREHGIQLCLSNPCFEVWLLSHFTRLARAFHDGPAAEKALSQHWRQRFGSDYHKADERIYDRLRPFRDTALDNARFIRERSHRQDRPLAECNSATEVYRLVSHLLGLS